MNQHRRAVVRSKHNKHTCTFWARLDRVIWVSRAKNEAIQQYVNQQTTELCSIINNFMLFAMKQSTNMFCTLWMKSAVYNKAVYGIFYWLNTPIYGYPLVLLSYFLLDKLFFYWLRYYLSNYMQFKFICVIQFR